MPVNPSVPFSQKLERANGWNGHSLSKYLKNLWKSHRIDVASIRRLELLIDVTANSAILIMQIDMLFLLKTRIQKHGSLIHRNICWCSKRKMTIASTNTTYRNNSLCHTPIYRQSQDWKLVHGIWWGIFASKREHYNFLFHPLQQKVLAKNM